VGIEQASHNNCESGGAYLVKVNKDIAGSQNAHHGGGATLSNHNQDKATTMEAIIIQPRKIEVVKPPSPIFDHMHQPWNPLFYQIPRKAILTGTVINPGEFSKAGPREVNNVNNMVVKLPGSDSFHIPLAQSQFKVTIQQIIDYEYAINPMANDYYAYITIRQGWVKVGKTQSHPSIHVDGLQGAKYVIKILPGQTYFVADGIPTRFFYHPFDFSAYSVNEYDYRTLMALQARIDQSYLMDQPYGIYLIDPYMVHQPTVAKLDTFRTFLRLQFTQREFVATDDMDNPTLVYRSKKEGPHVIPPNLKMLLRRDERGGRYYLDERGRRIDLPAAEDRAM